MTSQSLTINTNDLIYWFNALRNLPDDQRTRALDAVWGGQLQSKAWLVNTLKQYINGSLVATHTTQGNSSTGNYLQIGYEGCCGDRNFPGYISVIRIYNKPLSAADVLQNYNAQKSTFGL